MSELQESFDVFNKVSLRSQEVKTESEVKRFIDSSKILSWIYFIEFSKDIYAWGTATKNGARIRKTSLFNSKLTGKYDRRGDYLMLKTVSGMPKITLFEVNDAVAIEQTRRNQIYAGQRIGACFRGFKSSDRDSITLEIYEMYKASNAFKTLAPNEVKLFDEFIRAFYLGKLRHPNRNASFYYGDCMEPNFLDRTLGRYDLIPVIEKALSIKF